MTPHSVRPHRIAARTGRAALPALALAALAALPLAACRGQATASAVPGAGLGAVPDAGLPAVPDAGPPPGEGPQPLVVPDAGPPPLGNGTQPLDAVVLGPAVKVRPDHPVPGGRSATLVAARNEFGSFQVVVNASAGPLEKLTVALAGPLQGPGGAVIPVSSVTVYREAYYTVVTASDLQGAPGRWPDALVPAVDPLFGEARNAFPVDVPAGENRVAWVEVLVPPDAVPGRYEGVIAVRADGAGADVPISLTVLQLALPSTSSLKNSFGLSGGVCAPLGLPCATDPSAEAGARQLFVRSALDNRVSLGRVHALPVTPGIGVDQFRSYFLPFVKGTGQTRLHGARLTTYQVNSVLERNFAGFRSEAELDGFTDIAFVWSCDEPYFFPTFGDPTGNWLICRKKIDADAVTWPQAPKLVTAHVETATANDALKVVDIMVVNVELLDGPRGTPWHNQRPLYHAFLADTARAKQLWLYSACGSHGCVRNDPTTAGWAGGYQIDGPASETRAMPWLAFTYDVSGLIYYDTALQLATAWDDQYRYTGNGEGTLFYPGTPALIGGTHAIPIESLRLKHLRDGLQDYEYLKFLSDNGRAADARRIATALFPAFYDTDRTDEAIAAARLELARLAADVTGGPRP